MSQTGTGRSFFGKPDAPTNIMSDASDTAVGALLQQFIDGHWCQVAFLTQLNPSKVHFLAIYYAIKHFCHFVKGRNFTFLPTTNL